MNIILTWSRKCSHEIALYLREWLPEVIPGVVPWVSSEDIQKGKKWFTELMEKFKETCFSITCITTENVKSPWVYYEVGLIAAKSEQGVMCPYLVGVPVKLIQGTPLSEFQCSEADRTDTWKLIKSINKELKDKGHNEGLLETNFKQHWPKLKNKLDEIIEQMGEVEEEVTQVSQPKAPELSETARKLLIAASKDEHGQIIFVKHSGGTSVQVNSVNLVPSQEPPIVAKWNGALKDLINYGYVGGSGSIFTVTDTGFERAEQLITEDPILSLSEEAKQILHTTAKGAMNVVQLAAFDGGFQILAAGQSMIPNEFDHKQAATWKNGLEQLIKGGLLEKDGRGCYQLTRKGYDAETELFPDTERPEESEE